MAWLSRSKLSGYQIDNIKQELTIYPRKTTDIQTKEDPAPIFLFEEDEERDWIGIPRYYYQKRKAGDNEEILDVSYGRPIRDVSTKFRAFGPYVEQEEAISELQVALQAGKWGGVILKAAPGFGKALAHGEPVLTPNGYVPIEDLSVGDLVAGTDGNFHPVTGVYPQGERYLYRVKFTDDSHVDCDGGHLWTLDRRMDSYELETIETRELFNMFDFDKHLHRCQYWLPRNQPVSINDGESFAYANIDRAVKSIARIGRGLATCISVDSPDRLFLTRNCIPTHNTITSLELARRLGRKTLVLVHKDFLVRQWKKRINWLMPDARVGIIKQKICEFDELQANGEEPDFVIALLQSLSRDDGFKYSDKLYSAFGTIVADECFIGSTEVLTGRGVCRIDGVRSGDVVLNASGFGIVDEASSRLVDVESLRLVKMQDGAQYICTSSHAFFTSDSWVSSDNLCGKDVLTIRGCIDISRRHGKENSIDVSDVWEARVGQSWQEILFKSLYREVKKEDPGSLRILRTGKHKAEADKVLFEDLCSEMEVRECASLQGRQDHFCQKERPKERFFPDRIRVESVEIPKRADLERFGVCFEGDKVRVFNLGVSGHPSYVLVNGSVVHNCHRVAANSWSSVMPRFNAAWRIGISATPKRKDGAQDVFFHHISPITYSATTRMMRPKLRRIYTTSNLRPISRGNYQVSISNLNSAQVLNQLAADKFRTNQIVDDVVKGVIAGRKILVVSERLGHLKAMAERLGSVLFDKDLSFIPRLDFYTGQWFTNEKWTTTKRGKNGNILHRKGDYKLKTRTPQELERAESANVLFATKQIIEEAFDLPPIDVLVMATPMSDIEQMVGRCQRWCFPDEEKCKALCPWRAGQCKEKKQPIVVDVVDELIVQLNSKYQRRLRFYQKIGAL